MSLVHLSKRLYRFVLKRLIGQFLSSDLDLDQLDVGLREGRVELRDIDLNTDVISATLTSCSQASVALVRLSLPPSFNLASDSCVIELQGVRIQFNPGQGPPTTKRSSSTASGPPPEASPKVSVEPKSELQQGLEFLAQWIERVTSRVRVEVSDVRVTFLRQGDDAAAAFTLVVGKASYYDESNNGPVNRRGLVLSDVRCELTAAVDNDATTTVVVAQLSPTVPTTAKLVINKRKHRPSDVPLLECECFVHWIDVRLCHASLRALAHLADAFTQRPAAAAATSPRPMASSSHVDVLEKSLTSADLQRFKELLPWYDSEDDEDSERESLDDEYFDALEEDAHTASVRRPARQRYTVQLQFLKAQVAFAAAQADLDASTAATKWLAAAQTARLDCDLPRGCAVLLARAQGVTGGLVVAGHVTSRASLAAASLAVLEASATEHATVARFFPEGEAARAVYDADAGVELVASPVLVTWQSHRLARYLPAAATATPPPSPPPPPQATEARADEALSSWVTVRCPNLQVLFPCPALAERTTDAVLVEVSDLALNGELATASECALWLAEADGNRVLVAALEQSDAEAVEVRFRETAYSPSPPARGSPVKQRRLFELRDSDDDDDSSDEEDDTCIDDRVRRGGALAVRISAPRLVVDVAVDVYQRAAAVVSLLAEQELPAATAGDDEDDDPPLALFTCHSASLLLSTPAGRFSCDLLRCRVLSAGLDVWAEARDLCVKHGGAPVLYSAAWAVYDDGRTPMLLLHARQAAFSKEDQVWEQAVRLSVCGATLRLDDRSRWLAAFAEAVIPDGREVKVTCFSKFRATLFDTTVDFCPSLVDDDAGQGRALLALGRVRARANLVSSADVQTYQVSVLDAQLFLAQSNLPRDAVEHEAALGKRGLGVVHFAERHGLVRVMTAGSATLDVREDRQSGCEDVEVALPDVGLFTCADSCNVLIGLLSSSSSSAAAASSHHPPPPPPPVARSTSPALPTGMVLNRPAALRSSMATTTAAAPQRSDAEMSASELRRRYAQAKDSELSAAQLRSRYAPTLHLQPFVIDEYYSIGSLPSAAAQREEEGHARWLKKEPPTPERDWILFEGDDSDDEPAPVAAPVAAAMAAAAARKPAAETARRRADREDGGDDDDVAEEMELMPPSSPLLQPESSPAVEHSPRTSPLWSAHRPEPPPSPLPPLEPSPPSFEPPDVTLLAGDRLPPEDQASFMRLQSSLVASRAAASREADATRLEHSTAMQQSKIWHAGASLIVDEASGAAEEDDDDDGGGGDDDDDGGGGDDDDDEEDSLAGALESAPAGASPVPWGAQSTMGAWLHGTGGGGGGGDEDVKVFPHHVPVSVVAGPGSHVPPAQAMAARLLTEHSQARMATRWVLREARVSWRLFGGSDFGPAPDLASPALDSPPELPAVSQVLGEALLPNHAGKGPARAPRREHKAPPGSRDTARAVELILEGVCALVDADAAGRSHVGVSVHELRVLDHVASSPVRRLLGHWVNERERPRETDAAMVRLAIVSAPGRGDELHAALLPLRVHLDQDALELFRGFVNSPATDLSPPRRWGLVDFRAVELKLDYLPKRVDVARLAEGEAWEVLNLFPVQGLVVATRRVRLSWCTTAAVTDRWARDVSQMSLHNALAGVAPSAVAITKGVANLVLLPVDRLLDRQPQQPALTTLHGLVVDTLGLGAKLTSAAAGLLQGPSRRPRAAPKDAREGLQHAAQALSRGVKAASHTVVAVPLMHYQRDGASGLLRAVIRAVPVAVLAPVAGASEALASVLQGVRNEMDPDTFAEEQGKWKEGA